MYEMESVEEKKYLRVAIYLRLSDEDKDKANKLDDSESIKNQRNLLLEEIQKRPEFMLVDEYCDEDLSGAGTFRPEFERLIKDCENKKIDIVLDIYNFLKSKSNLILDEVVYNTILDGLSKASMYDKALEIYQDMINNQMKKSNTTCSIMIKIYSKLGDVEKAEAIFDEMNTPSLITLT